MPASAYSSSFSWGAYFLASLFLVAALYPALSGLSGYSEAVASESIAEGISADIAGLRQGMSVSVSFTYLPPGTSVTMHSHTLLVASGAASTEIHLGPQVPNLTVVPGAVYLFTLNGSRAEVEEIV